MTYHRIKKLFDEYLEKNYPEIDFYNSKESENCIEFYRNDDKSYVPFRNLYFRKRIMDLDKKQFLTRNPYNHNWKEENLDKYFYKDCKKTDMSDKRIYKCTLDNCNRQYTSAFGLKYHMKEGHSKEKLNVHKPYVCNIQGCGRKYKYNNGLKYHLKTFHNIS